MGNLQLTSKKTSQTAWLRKFGQNWIDISPMKMWMADTYMKKCSTFRCHQGNTNQNQNEITTSHQLGWLLSTYTNER